MQIEKWEQETMKEGIKKKPEKHTDNWCNILYKIRKQEYQA